jgi:hypothetical protein
MREYLHINISTMEQIVASSVAESVLEDNTANNNQLDSVDWSLAHDFFLRFPEVPEALVECLLEVKTLAFSSDSSRK